MAKEPLEFKPGEKWNYCNTGYFLLGMLIEKVSGKPYGEFMAERVFKPLGMTRTRANDLRAIIPNRAQGYEWDGKELRNGEYVSPSQPFAAGMLVSSVSDLVKWDAALSRPHAARRADPRADVDADAAERRAEAGYGFGWEISKVNGHRLVSHGGGIPGFSTELSRFPDDKLTVIVLTNAEGGHAGAIARRIAGQFVPELAEKAEEPIADEDDGDHRTHQGDVRRALKGEVDEALFTDEAKKQLVPRIRGDKERLASFGALKSFQLLERKESDGGLTVAVSAGAREGDPQVVRLARQGWQDPGAGIQPED